jgi:hypothetical protein
MALMTVSASTIELRAGDDLGARAAGLVGFAQAHADALDARDAVGADELDGRDLGHDLDAFALAAWISCLKAGMSDSLRR